MQAREIESILQSLLSKEAVAFDPPSLEDWNLLESQFGCRFGEDFKFFIALMSRYQFPGDILNVSSGKTNGNDTIAIAFDYEMRFSTWHSEMIPFYAIGNGDYFCLNKNECPCSRVFYYYADRQTFEPYAVSFSEWLRQLPAFLA